MAAGRVAAVLAAGVLASCASSRELVIPREPEVRARNFAAEYLQIASEYESLKDYARAVDYYRLAAQKDPSAENAISYKIARCQALAQNWAEARPAYEALLAQDEDNMSLKVSLAYITAMGGDFADAILQYQALVAEHPADGSLLKSYIAVLMADGKYELAEKQYYVLKKEFPDDESLPAIQAKLADGLGL